MASTLAELFREISQQATSFDEPILALLCRTAALEAERVGMPFTGGTRKIIGIWDWDVANNLNHADPGLAELFGLDPVKAGQGLPNDHFITGIHPDDLPNFSLSLTAALKIGGVFQAEYRVVRNGLVKRVLARGFCTLDKFRRPERLPGAIMELSPFSSPHESCLQLS